MRVAKSPTSSAQNSVPVSDSKYIRSTPDVTYRRASPAASLVHRLQLAHFNTTDFIQPIKESRGRNLPSLKIPLVQRYSFHSFCLHPQGKPSLRSPSSTTVAALRRSCNRDDLLSGKTPDPFSEYNIGNRLDETNDEKPVAPIPANRDNIPAPAHALLVIVCTGVQSAIA